jgi:hypothetical protein
VTVSLLKSLPWQTMHFLQRSIHLSKTCCRPFAVCFRRIVEQVASCLVVPFSWSEKPKNRMRARSGLYGGYSNGVPQISMSTSITSFQSRNADAPLRLLRHSKKSSFKTTVTPFSRSDWSIVRRASLAKEGTSKKRPSPHLHKVPTRSNKVSARTLQTALVHSLVCVCVGGGSFITYFNELLSSYLFTGVYKPDKICMT